jgi:hypothetical protein
MQAEYADVVCLETTLRYLDEVPGDLVCAPGR